MKENKKDSALNETVIKLGLVSFFADVASELLYPITPIFLTSVLGSSMASVGLIEGVAEGIASLLKAYSGIWSDSASKRKPFIVVGYLMAALSKPFIGLSTTWFHVLSARAFDRMGKGIRSAPRDSLIADSVSEQHRGAAFGWHRGMDTLGAAVGPLLAIFLLNSNLTSLRSIYFWALIPGLLSVVVVLFIKENPRVLVSKKQVSPFSIWSRFNPRFKKYLLVWGLFSLVNSSDVFLLMKVKDSGLSTTLVIALYCGYNLVYSISSPFLGILSDRLERKKLMIAGIILFGLVYFGFSQATELWQFGGLFLVYGLYMGATDGVGKALAVDLSEKDQKGAALGVLGTVTGSCTIFASVVAGQLWDHAGAPWTFYYGAIGALLAVVVLMTIEIHPKNN